MITQFLQIVQRPAEVAPPRRFVEHAGSVSQTIKAEREACEPTYFQPTLGVARVEAPSEFAQRRKGCDLKSQGLRLCIRPEDSEAIPSLEAFSQSLKGGASSSASSAR